MTQTRHRADESDAPVGQHERPLLEAPVDPLDRTRFPAEEWRLVERAYDNADLGVTETIFAVGNGYLGMRGNVEEGRDTHTHGTFINGFHETWRIQHAEEAYGLARVGQTIVHVPDPKVIKLYVEDEPLLLADADLEEYERSLDFRDGQLRRSLIWRTSSGKRVRVTTSRMVSFAERHLGLMSMDLELLDGDAPIVISSQLLNRQDGFDEYHVPSAAMGEGVDPRKAEGFDRRVLDPQHHSTQDGRAELGYVCAESRMTLAVAVDHVMETENPYTTEVLAEPDSAKQVFRIEARQGHPIHLEKFAVYHTSRGVPVRELIDRCRRTLDRVRADGLEHLQQEQRDWLEDFWSRADVRVPGQPAVQQAIRWNLFQLAQASARADTAGIAAKGVTGSGYGGHYFWDTEVYVMPFLTYTSPQTARNALRFRHNMLDAARSRARDMSQEGALFPWRTINGAEASAYFAAGTAQYHINADVAHALVQYVNATGDRRFRLEEGLDILVETARMWADLGFWGTNGDAAFHIHGVTGPDEYTTVVDDNLFTNVMARANLVSAVEAVTELRASDPRDYARAVQRLGLTDGEVTAWQRAADGMFIPFDEALGVHPQDKHFLEHEVWDLPQTPADKRPLLLHFHPLVIYRFQVIKQADVVLAMYLAGQSFTPEEKRANFEYYDPITTGDSSLSAVVQSIMAAEVGYHEMALRYFYDSLFVDLADRHGNTADGVHVASTGGAWGSLVGGFGGMRDHDGMLRFDPRLPDDWAELGFGLCWQGSRLEVVVRATDLRLRVTDGVPIEVDVRGETVQVGAEDVVVPLDGMGPRIDGILPPTPVVGAHTQEGQRLISAAPRD
ncbi:glycoside hydrolase family 65 protein [Ornithinimicrobium cavernae]|uniref:glycoside hydrolase family 65 protein n=1 Tax=Ornithinimicrobium cavernae TaxID=2666047 RepID=UPI000D698AD2|nr:glycosyl hydrolase family 65 protein [Ornithinimicrobium cavernae]